MHWKKKIMNTINKELNLDESEDDDQNYANRDMWVIITYIKWLKSMH